MFKNVNPETPHSRSVQRSVSGSSGLSQEIILIHHTDCGMLTFSDDVFKDQICQEVGIKPSWAAEAFSDLDADVRQSIDRIKADPFIPVKTSIRGFIYDVYSGGIKEVHQ